MAEVEPARAATPPAGSGRLKPFAELGLLLLVGLACALALAAYSRSLPPARQRKFDASALERVKDDRPDIVFIGNSMVYTRFDEQLLNELVRPTKVSLIATSASQSAIWYAQLRYSVAAARAPVRRVVIFFRDRELTLPALRATGSFTKNLERWLPKPDPIVRRKLAPPKPGPIQALGFALADAAPLERVRARATDVTDDALVSVFLHSDPNALHRRVNRLFRVDELRDRADDAQPNWDETAPFSAVVSESFLPDMLDVARANDIELEFVRLRRRRTAEGKPEKPGVPEYLAELRRYLLAHGARYRDLSPNGWESLDLYGSGDHIAGPRLRAYTRLFVRNERSLFDVSALGPARGRAEKQPP